MPETKNNRRVRFTRSALREALIDLILEKPLVSITVKDICARADINRCASTRRRTNGSSTICRRSRGSLSTFWSRSGTIRV